MSIDFCTFSIKDELCGYHHDFSSITAPAMIHISEYELIRENGTDRSSTAGAIERVKVGVTVREK